MRKEARVERKREDVDYYMAKYAEYNKLYKNETNKFLRKIFDCITNYYLNKAASTLNYCAKYYVSIR